MSDGRTADDDDLGYWIALTRIKGIRVKRFELLVDRFKTARAAWEAAYGSRIIAGRRAPAPRAVSGGRHSVT